MLFISIKQNILYKLRNWRSYARGSEIFGSMDSNLRNSTVVRESVALAGLMGMMVFYSPKKDYCSVLRAGPVRRLLTRSESLLNFDGLEDDLSVESWELSLHDCMLYAY